MIEATRPFRPATLALGLLAACAPLTAAHAQQTGSLTISVDKPGVKISPIFYGMMTEEINHSFDGGLYAELVRNRQLQDAATPDHWSLTDATAGTMTLDETQPVPNTTLTRSLRLDATKAGEGVQNAGFWGVPVKPNTTYQISFWAKSDNDFKGELSASIESKVGKVSFASTRSGPLTTGWKKYSGTLQTGAIEASMDNVLSLRASAPGTVWVTLVSLFPPTYKNRPNGNRIDLMEKMVAMKPSFLRFPGGNYLDPSHYEWKKTIGPLEQRSVGAGAFEYKSSNGIGILEFFQWCEDLKIEPVLGVSAGRGWLADDADFEFLVQDAMDEIEYATGGLNTKWGALRAQHGHPKPFPLHYVEIGNEDIYGPLEVYEKRFNKLYDAIKAKYPALQIISTRPDLTERKPDVVDEHYYRPARALAVEHVHYDETDRKGPKIFVGEWAATEWATIKGAPTSNMQAGLGDAAFLTGLLRNSDQVIMEAYAPLFVNVNPGARQWYPNLIGFDALHSYGSPSYYVQSMFAQNTGDVILPLQNNVNTITDDRFRGRVGVGTNFTKAQFDDLKVTAPDGKVLYSQDFSGDISEFDKQSGEWEVKDGIYTQSKGDWGSISLVGDVNWKDYDYTLRARKTSGNEGFLIPFRSIDVDTFLWWSVGADNNKLSQIQRGYDGGPNNVDAGVPFKVEDGRWYDLKLEVRGRKIRTFIDGKLINEVTDNPPTQFYSVASRDTKTGDIFLKAVNFTPQAQKVKIVLNGTKGLSKTATAQVLVGEPSATNSIENPTEIVPQTMTINDVAPNFTHEFPANSVTVVRFKAAK